MVHKNQAASIPRLPPSGGSGLAGSPARLGASRSSPDDEPSSAPNSEAKRFDRRALPQPRVLSSRLPQQGPSISSNAADRTRPLRHWGCHNQCTCSHTYSTISTLRITYTAALVNLRGGENEHAVLLRSHHAQGELQRALAGLRAVQAHHVLRKSLEERCWHTKAAHTRKRQHSTFIFLVGRTVTLSCAWGNADDERMFVAAAVKKATPNQQERPKLIGE